MYAQSGRETRQAGWHRRSLSCPSVRRWDILFWKNSKAEEELRMEGKIAILGAGHVGSHVARALAACEAAEEIVLIDKLQEKASAQAMDIADSLSFSSGKIRVRAGSYGDCADADITVSAIGKPREPGQTRLDLLGDSVRMAHELAGQLGEKGVGGLLVSITNPCDIIAGCLRRLLGMDRFRAFGTGTLLDTARLIRILSEQTGVPCCGIEALVLGEHGDSSMIPYSALRIDGVPAAEVPGFNPEEALERTHSIGMDIINGKGSTEFGIGQAAAFLCKTILSGKKRTLPLSVSLDGEYGLSGFNCGVPCTVGRNGIESVLQLELARSEREALQATAAVLEKHTRLADEIIAGL